MPDNTEVFPNPTVRQVVFEIRFPVLFFLEQKIGEIQVDLMGRFPKAQLLHQQSVMFAQGVEGKIPEDVFKGAGGGTAKIWQFQDASSSITISFQLNKMDISSTLHKTYNSANSANRFRETLEFVMTPFLRKTNIPTLQRVGLRYTDECPLPNRTTDEFNRHYSSTFPTGRFRIEDTKEFEFASVVSREDVFMRYYEALPAEQKNLVLDFDGFALNVPSAEWLTTTDKLHRIISEEYFRTIKDPVKTHMRTPRG